MPSASSFSVMFRFAAQLAQAENSTPAISAIFISAQTESSSKISFCGAPQMITVTLSHQWFSMELQAYIINTGKWMSLNDYRKRQTPLTFDTDYVMRYDAVVDEESDFEKNEKLAVIRSAVKEMKMPCSKLLYLAIYYEKSHEEIASIMHYANARTVTTQRSRCTQKLIGFLRKRFKELGYEY